MAQHNAATLYGYLPLDPRIITDEEGNPIRAEMYITTAIGTRPYKGDDEKNKYNTASVLVRTGREDLIQKMSELRQFDSIFLKGTVTTRNSVKKRKCDGCGQIYKVEPSNGNGEDVYDTFLSTFISPVNFSLVESANSQEEAQMFIRENRDISNSVILIGNLCSDPVRKKSGDKKVTIYNLGINRKYYIEDDDPENASDYPFVRAYGRQGHDDGHLLRQGSLVLVDGFIRSRRFTRDVECPYCGRAEKIVDTTSEIVSYSTEYLANYLTQKEYDELRKEQNAIELEKIKKELNQ